MPSLLLKPISSLMGCPSLVSRVHFTVCTYVGNSMICVVSGEYTTHPVPTGISDAHPSRAHRNFRCPALRARQVDLHTHVPSLNPRHAHSKRQHKQHHQQHRCSNHNIPQPWNLWPQRKLRILSPSLPENVHNQFPPFHAHLPVNVMVPRMA